MSFFSKYGIFINNIMLEQLKEENMERGLFCDIDVMNTENERWNIIKKLDEENDKHENLLDKIQDFMFSFQIRDKKDIEKLNEYTASTKKDFLHYVKNNLTSKTDPAKKLDSFFDYFTIMPVDMDPNGIITKINSPIAPYF